MRSGETAGLRALEVKALSIGSNPDGGYLVPPEVETQIGARLTAISPIRGIAGVRTISANVYKKPFMTAGPAVGWVGETDARTQTATPALDELSFPAMELYVMPAATATLLEDAAVNIDQWLAQEVETVFAAQEGTASFPATVPKSRRACSATRRSTTTTGVGQDRHRGERRVGRLPVVQPVRRTGRADLRAQGQLPAERRLHNEPQDAIGHSQVQGHDRQLSLAAAGGAGGNGSLMTFPVYEAEDMPDVAAGSLSIAFGDFNRGYLIVDRAGVSVLRDPFTAKPYVLFYTTKRLGGGVQDFDAIKLMKFSAS